MTKTLEQAFNNALKLYNKGFSPSACLIKIFGNTKQFYPFKKYARSQGIEFDNFRGMSKLEKRLRRKGVLMNGKQKTRESRQTTQKIPLS